jgi:hypothetical protein
MAQTPAALGVLEFRLPMFVHREQECCHFRVPPLGKACLTRKSLRWKVIRSLGTVRAHLVRRIQFVTVT